LQKNSSHSTTHRTQAKPSSWAARLGDQLHQAGTSASGQPLIRPQPHPGQQLFLDCDHPRRLLLAHRRFGKDWATVMDIQQRIEGWRQEPHRRRLEPAIHIGVIYPTYELVDDFWGALKRMIPRSEVAECWNGKPQRLTLKCGAVIAVRTASDPDLLVSRGYDLLVLGEAARMSRDAWLTLLPALASPGRAGLAVHQTTPLGQNWIAAEAQDPSWWQLVVPIWEPGSQQRHPLANPHIPQEAILEEERQLPEQWFRREWLVDFLSSEGTMFRDVRAHIAAAPPDPKRPVVVPVDLAKRQDFTVFSAFDAAGRQCGLDRMHGIPYPQQEARLVAFCHEHGAKKVIIEENGPGIPVLEHLPELFRDTGVRCEVAGFTTTAQSKSLIINDLALAFERPGQVCLMPDEVQTAEFEAYEATKTPSGNETYGAPEGQHDDCVMAAAFAWTELAGRRKRYKGSVPKPGQFSGLRKKSFAEERDGRPMERRFSVRSQSARLKSIRIARNR